MKRVECIDNAGMENTISLGETYVLLKETKKYYVVKLKVTKGEYLKYRFKKVEDQKSY